MLTYQTFFRFPKMTCSCATNVQTAFILGIIGIVFHLIFVGILAGILIGISTTTRIPTRILWYGGITVGIFYALISAILVYGAYARNRAVILIWIIFAILECVGAVLILIIICHLGEGKVIYPKYSKHWPYTVADTIDCVCRKC